MSETISGEHVSAQIGKMRVIAGMSDGNFIETQFDYGCNPENVKAVKQTSLSGINLKYEY